MSTHVAPSGPHAAGARRLDVEFQSGGETCRGWLYLPEGDGPHPAVVLAGGWCYVKEVVMPGYAEAFARSGLASLVFDYRRLGASDGEPRQHLDPWDQIEDYRNGLSFLEQHGEIDSARLGAWGISYSGGHALILAAIDPRLKAAVSIVPVIDGYHNMRLIHGTLGFRDFTKLLVEDRARRFANGGVGGRLAHISESEMSTWPGGRSARETFQVLKDTVAPGYQNSSTIESAELLMNYDVGPFVRRILGVPTLMLVAEGDDLTMWDLEIDAFNAIPTADKKLVVLPDTGHMSLYSDERRLEVAARESAAWLSTHLAG